MTVLYYVTIVLHVIACLFLIGVVLLQQGKGQDLASAFGGGGTQTAFGPRGSANVLSRATTILAGLFMVTSLALTVLRAGRQLGARPGPGTGGFAEPAASPVVPAAAADPRRGSDRRAASPAPRPPRLRPSKRHSSGGGRLVGHREPGLSSVKGSRSSRVSPDELVARLMTSW